MEAPLLGISPKMYRHFAVITVALSAMIAMFADGDRREAIADGIEQHQQQIARDNGKQRADAASRSVAKASATTGAWGQDSAEGFGSPVDDSPASDVGVSYVPSSSAGTIPSADRVDPALLARMSPEQRAAYLKKLQDDRRKRAEEEAQQAPTRQQIDSLIAASAARSGN